jgi:serine/threonine-protein kinase HipA
MEKLSVWLSGKQAGLLSNDEAGFMEFSYLEDYLEDPNAKALSRQLPLQSGTFAHKPTRAFFAGVLPEEEIRDRIAQLLGISKENDFAMLEQIGGECAGAISLVPDGVNPASSMGPSTQKLGDDDLAALIRELPNRPLMAGQSGLRLSLAGAQGKVPIIVKDGQISLPLNNSASTHILKPEPQRFPGLAANETFCMVLAKKVGLDVAEIEYRQLAEHKFVLVKRYDREIVEGGEVIRLHQEDFCQALGYPPERKYQVEGGPTVKECVQLIWDWSSIPALDLTDFMKRLVFNTLIGNADAHGKNFSYLYQGSERRISPAYDLVSTIAWPKLTQNAAMKIGNGSSINAFGIGEWKKLASTVDASWPLLSDRIKELAEGVIAHADEVAVELESTGDRVILNLAKVLKDRSTKLLTNISSSTL